MSEQMVRIDPSVEFQEQVALTDHFKNRSLIAAQKLAEAQSYNLVLVNKVAELEKRLETISAERGNSR